MASSLARLIHRTASSLLAPLAIVAAGSIAGCKSCESSAPAAVLPISPNPGGEWLHTEHNRILTADGKPFHGRGANIQDTRSCDACTTEPPNRAEVIRRIDELVDVWHANFLRLTMESYFPPGARVQFKNAADDPAYLADLVAIVKHIETKPGVYVLLSVWHDPTLDANGWPTARTQKLWKTIVPAFATSPRVLFGVATEPERNDDGAMDAAAWDSFNGAVDAIRQAEGNGPHHLAVVQGLGGWARRLDYYVSHPITAGGGIDVAYEVHLYDPKAKVDALIAGPAQNLPVIIGEFAPIDDAKLGAHMSNEDVSYLMTQAEAHEIPYLAWTFHMRCPPSLLVDNSNNSCGAKMALTPTPWGQLFKDRLAKPYGAP
jgi:hypothetical protein